MIHVVFRHNAADDPLSGGLDGDGGRGREGLCDVVIAAYVGQLRSAPDPLGATGLRTASTTPDRQGRRQLHRRGQTRQRGPMLLRYHYPR